MGKKSRSKKQRRQEKEAQKKLEEQPIYWEELVDAKNQLVESLVSNQQLIGTLFNSYGDKVENESNERKEFRQSIHGLLKTFTDVVPRIRNIMDKHLVEEKELENGEKEFIFKEGKVDMSNDELFDYIEISNGYKELGHVIADVTSIGFTDLFTKIQTLEPGVVDQKDIDMITEVTNKGKMEVLKEELKLAAAMPGGDQAIQGVMDIVNAMDSEAESTQEGESHGEQ